ncbi:hypothetical protein IPL68_01665 [Candidatus Saccharibacteria bacterium]|nr:MAG: hypothetical protein IPL68_01665 [Candidatus Saccharibacteria bacterium]
MLDNTDAQAISLAGDTLSITGNASTVDLASYLDNTDAQTVGLVGTTLTISGGNSIDLAPINTDAQTLGLVGTNPSITGGNTIDLSSIDTDSLAGLSCSPNQIAKWNGSAWACAADVDTDTVLNEVQVDAYANNNGYLTSEVDGSITNEIQSLSLVADILSISGDPGTIDLSAYLDNTDAQTLSYNLVLRFLRLPVATRLTNLACSTIQTLKLSLAPVTPYPSLAMPVPSTLVPTSTILIQTP